MGTRCQGPTFCTSIRHPIEDPRAGGSVGRAHKLSPRLTHEMGHWIPFWDHWGQRAGTCRAPSGTPNTHKVRGIRGTQVSRHHRAREEVAGTVGIGGRTTHHGGRRDSAGSPVQAPLETSPSADPWRRPTPTQDPYVTGSQIRLTQSPSLSLTTAEGQGGLQEVVAAAGGAEQGALVPETTACRLSPIPAALLWPVRSWSPLTIAVASLFPFLRHPTHCLHLCPPPSLIHPGEPPQI